LGGKIDSHPERRRRRGVIENDQKKRTNPEPLKGPTPMASPGMREKKGRKNQTTGQ